MSPPPDAAALGYDVSWPQCGARLPNPAKFAVIGVNGGRPGTENPCLLTQLAWGAGTAGAAAGIPVPVYVNTANPGRDGSSWWPASNAYRGKKVTNPYGVCDGTSSPACAYTYGYALAFDDANLRGVPDPAHHLWWLDVETGNSWSPDTAANTADLEGMTAYLQSTGAEVGIYSTAHQLGKIAGTVGPGSNLNKLKNWIPGADSTASAQAKCASEPLTPGGTITMTQFTAGDLDYNYPCPTTPSNPSALHPGQVPSPSPARMPEQSPRPAYAPQPISYTTSQTNTLPEVPGTALQCDTAADPSPGRSEHGRAPGDPTDIGGCSGPEVL
ncbi:hypothetical protein [Arthrobacter sp. C9C5]|uniref:hypothetical protein n=1 Tax=Arthrobacter sp. C9C5 TaxID=2735267 RepID=UPI00158503F4